MRWLVVTLIMLTIVVAFLFWKNLSTPKTIGLVGGRLQPCPKSPNCVCCCPGDEEHAIAPLPLASQHTLDQIQAFLCAHYIAEVIQRTPEYLYVVVTTPLCRFRDDLEFVVNDGMVLVRSASRVGYGDGGINRARIEALRTFLERGH